MKTTFRHGDRFRSTIIKTENFLRIRFIQRGSGSDYTQSYRRKGYFRAHAHGRREVFVLPTSGPCDAGYRYNHLPPYRLDEEPGGCHQGFED